MVKGIESVALLHLVAAVLTHFIRLVCSGCCGLEKFTVE